MRGLRAARRPGYHANAAVAAASGRHHRALAVLAAAGHHRCATGFLGAIPRAFRLGCGSCRAGLAGERR